MKHKNHQNGFSLVELMIAMVLGLVIMGGAIAVLLSNKQAHRTNSALSQMQDSSRVSFELLARDIRQAGLAGCGPQNQVFNALNSPADHWYSDLSTYIRGYVGAPTGTGAPAPGNQITASDSIIVKGIAGSGLSVASHAAPKIVTSQMNSGYLQDGDITVICDPSGASVTQITAISNATTTVHLTSGSTPGNSVATYGRVYGNNAQLGKLSSVYWYIGTNPRGGRSLYRLALISATGNAAVSTQEMVPNVAEMQLQYLVPGAGYVAANSTALTSWDDVTAVVITLNIQTDEQNTGTDGQALTRSFSSTVALRNRLN